MKINVAREIWDLIHKKGEGIFKKVHILNIGELNGGEYRIYHSDGFCFDSKAEYCCDPSEVDQYSGVEEDGFSYTFFSGYEGFQDIPETEALRILKRALR